MPFGLCNAPTSFQRMMNGIFGDLIGQSVLVYLDDTTIFTKTFEEHLQVIEEVFKRLREHTLYLKPKKCNFAAHEAKILGFIVNDKGVTTNPDKIADVAKFPRPTSQTEVRAFLGLANYYRKLIKDF